MVSDDIFYLTFTKWVNGVVEKSQVNEVADMEVEAKAACEFWLKVASCTLRLPPFIVGDLAVFLPL